MIDKFIVNRLRKNTKLLHRCKGVFSKTRRTLTSTPQFRIGPICGSDELLTTALNIRFKNTTYVILRTVNPAHNCKCQCPDTGNALAADWKTVLINFLRKISYDYMILPVSKYRRIRIDIRNLTCKILRFRISEKNFDCRPRGLSLHQLDILKYAQKAIENTTILHFLNGTVGYRTDSEDSKGVQGLVYCALSKVLNRAQYSYRDSRYMFGTEVNHKY